MNEFAAFSPAIGPNPVGQVDAAGATNQAAEGIHQIGVLNVQKGTVEAQLKQRAAEMKQQAMQHLGDAFQRAGETYVARQEKAKDRAHAEAMQAQYIKGMQESNEKAARFAENLATERAGRQARLDALFANEDKTPYLVAQLNANREDATWNHMTNLAQQQNFDNFSQFNRRLAGDFFNQGALSTETSAGVMKGMGEAAGQYKDYHTNVAPFSGVDAGTVINTDGVDWSKGAAVLPGLLDANGHKAQSQILQGTLDAYGGTTGTPTGNLPAVVKQSGVAWLQDARTAINAKLNDPNAVLTPEQRNGMIQASNTIDRTTAGYLKQDAPHNDFLSASSAHHDSGLMDMFWEPGKAQEGMAKLRSDYETAHNQRLQMEKDLVGYSQMNGEHKAQLREIAAKAAGSTNWVDFEGYMTQASVLNDSWRRQQAPMMDKFKGYAGAGNPPPAVNPATSYGAAATSSRGNNIVETQPGDPGYDLEHPKYEMLRPNAPPTYYNAAQSFAPAAAPASAPAQESNSRYGATPTRGDY